ncbi:ATP-binding cassette domain-containing protein [Limnobaculum zhutongyuii]|uniref:ATP-binding cassette domain-containing protein n=1 Tax=Limnobaculum zhutongyuii TaxID=2498113 RepID=A0A411WK90_9GAMM|nr:ATP-binding cassette domain-containing protein [Limnobaculum zhutongyuii]QBH96624.1 ATP-binding cassette domain-containing protein [Limnobaculum zhutongyuii]TQS90345.1 ATP-binding cassette domain-containing protein [Limnobaculum zhutongyuii]
MLKVNNLSCGILKQVSFSVEHGTCTAICGPSGSGKTTLLNAIVGNIHYQGSISIADQCIDTLPIWQRPCRYLNQRLYLFPYLTVENNLRLAQYAAKQPQDWQKRRDLLQLLEIEHLAKRYPSQISGGEQQRAALARALISQPRLLLLDEPFSSLDWSVRLRLWQALKTIQSEFSVTLLLVSHEPKEVEALARQHLAIDDGRLLAVTTNG